MPESAFETGREASGTTSEPSDVVFVSIVKVAAALATFMGGFQPALTALLALLPTYVKGVTARPAPVLATREAAIPLIATMFTNHVTEAGAKLESLERLAEVLDDHQVRALAAAQLAVLAVTDNDWRTAQILTARAGELAADHGLTDAAPLILVTANSDAL